MHYRTIAKGALHKIVTLSTVFVLTISGLGTVMLLATEKAAAADASSITVLRISQAPNTLSDVGETTSFSVKAVYETAFGWTNVLALKNPTMVSVSTTSGQVAPSCDPAAVWGTSASKAISIGQVVEGSFCFKGNQAGLSTVAAAASIPRLLGGTTNSTLDVPVTVAQEPPATPAPTGLGYIDPTVACGGATTSGVATATWSAVPGATSYEYSVITPQRTASNPYATTIASPAFVGIFNEDQGLYTFKVRAQYGNSTWSDWSSSCSILYVATKPAPPEGGAPHNTYLATNEFDFTWNASSDLLPVTYEYQTSQNSSQTEGVLTGSDLWKSPTPLTNPMIHSSGAGDGTWYWQVRAIDSLGQKSAWSQIWNVTLDTDDPDANITNPANGVTVGNDALVPITGMVSDAHLTGYKLYINGVIVEQASTSETSQTISYNWATAGLSSGAYTIALEGVDKAGHSTTFSIAVTIDNEGPDVTITPKNNTFNGGKVQPNVVAADVPSTESETLSYKWVAVDASDASMISDPLAKEPTFSPTSAGTYTFRLTVTDAYGNKTTKDFTFTWLPLLAAVITSIPTAPIPEPTPTPAGLVATQFNTTNPQTLGIATETAASDNETKVKKSSTNPVKEKEVITQTSSNNGWWLLLVIAVLFASYYGYRNWKLSQANKQ